MPLTLLIATSNAGKLRDFRTAAMRSPVAIAPMPGLEALTPPEETGTSFAANARLKAEFYSLHCPGQLVVADDSGLEVTALGHEPGVRSARYADDHGFWPLPAHPSAHPSDSPSAALSGNPSAVASAEITTDERNNLLLLKKMQPGHDRAARYRCVLSLARDGAEIASAEGELAGQILAEPRGCEGFGYDPIFFVPEIGLTMAEVDPETRLRLSHRGAALRALLAKLPTLPEWSRAVSL